MYFYLKQKQLNKIKRETKKNKGALHELHFQEVLTCGNYFSVRIVHYLVFPLIYDNEAFYVFKIFILGRQNGLANERPLKRRGNILSQKITGVWAQPDSSLNSDWVVEWHLANYFTFLGLSFHIGKREPMKST